MPSWEEGHCSGKDSEVKHVQAWTSRGWVTHKEEGRRGEKNARVKGAKVWAV